MDPVMLIVMLAIVAGGGFLVGLSVARSNTLPRRDQEELDARRTFMNDLMVGAAQYTPHDQFAVVVLAKTREFYYAHIEKGTR